MTGMLRQGDVLLVPCNVSMDGAKEIQPRNGRLILAEGEATGHHHRVDSRTAGLFNLAGKVVMVVNKPTVLTHQEHGAINVAPGQYWVVGQREYTPKAIRRVMD